MSYNTTTLKDRLVGSLESLNTTYFNGESSASMNCLKTSGLASVTTLSDILSLTKPNASPWAVTTTNPTQAHVVTNVNTRTNAPNTTISSSYITDYSNVVDICCLKFLDTANATPATATASTTFLNYIQGLYAWYDACHSSHWTDWNKASSTYTPKYPSASNGSLVSSSVDTYMNKVLDIDVVKADTHFNPYVARRIFHLFILMANATIALEVYNNESTAEPVVNACFQLLAKQNYIVSYNGSGSTMGVDQAISYAINNNSAMYNANYTRITNLNEKMIKNKEELSSSQNMIEEQAVAHKTLRIYEYVAISIFIVICILAMTLIIFPFDKNKRLAGCGALIILSVVNAFVLTFVFKKKSATYYEGFAGASQDQSYGYKVSILSDAILYVNNTKNLVNLLQTYRTFENMNYSLNKEIDYYSDASEQLLNSKLKLQDFYNVSYMEDIQYSALMNLLISLSLIVSGTTTAYVATESTMSGQTYSVGVGGALSIIAITIFLMEVNTRVHTDPRRIYWGAPDTNTM